MTRTSNGMPRPFDERSGQADEPRFFEGLTLATQASPSNAAALFDAVGRQRLRRMLKLPASWASGPVGQTWRKVRACVVALARHDLAAAVAMAHEPTVACLVHAIVDVDVPRRDRRKLDRHLHALNLGLLAELAARRHLPSAISVDLRGVGYPGIHAISCNLHLPAADLDTIHFDAGTVETAGPNGTSRIALDHDSGEPGPYHQLWEAVHLATVDNNPDDLFGNHPDQPDGRRVGLGSSGAQAWVQRFAEAFALVARLMPELAADWRHHARLIIPVGDDPERHFSATYPGVPGASYMSLHPDLMTVAEAVIHELQHDKLHAAWRLDPLLTNRPDERFVSPLRPDPRPMRGILLAAHAFVPVGVFHRRLEADGHPLTARPRWRRRFDAVLAKNADALRVIDENARVTSAGRGLVAGLKAIDASVRA